MACHRLYLLRLFKTHHVVGSDQLVQRGGEKAELMAVLSDAVAHVVSLVAPGGSDILKIARLGRWATMGRGFFSQSDVTTAGVRRLGGMIGSG